MSWYDYGKSWYDYGLESADSVSDAAYDTATSIANAGYAVATAPVDATVIAYSEFDRQTDKANEVLGNVAAIAKWGAVAVGSAVVGGLGWLAFKRLTGVGK